MGDIRVAMGDVGEGTLVSFFRSFDPDATGRIPRKNLEWVLCQLGCSERDVALVLESSGAAHQDSVQYQDFIKWVSQDDLVSSTPAEGKLGGTTSSGSTTCWPDRTTAQTLAEMAASLSDLACAASRGQACDGKLLAWHAASLRAMLAHLPIEALSTMPQANVFEASGTPQRTPRSSGGNSPPGGHREAAAEILERTGSSGTMVDDLVEINPSEIADKHAISHWRMCPGLRVYRSETVTRALKHICSEPVPDLNGSNFLDVYKALTLSSWTHHVYLFGGLVRDILRRIVGADLDINFSAPAKEIRDICLRHGWPAELKFGDDYCLIGSDANEVYLEGFVITHNPVASYHADFSMNVLYYDFVNEVIVDKTGLAVTAIAANACEIPCLRAEWDMWLKSNGCRVLFRYFKFLVRGYTYSEESMVYVTERLLEFWARSGEETIVIGRIALGKMVGSSDGKKLALLKDLVFKSYNLATQGQSEQLVRSRSKSRGVSKEQVKIRQEAVDVAGHVVSDSAVFFSATSWWDHGWLPLLQLPGPPVS